MNKDLIIEKALKISAPAAKIWEALTNPVIIKQYLFGTETVTDWKVGSAIIFQGEGEGKAYKDKGKIQKFDPEKILEYTYWSGFSGLEDTEENYSLVTFELNEDNGITTLIFTQKGFTNEKAQEHSATNWGMVLQKIKELVEAAK